MAHDEGPSYALYDLCFITSYCISYSVFNLMIGLFLID